MVAREPCTGRTNFAAKSRQTGEPRLQDFFVEWNSGLGDLFHASGRRTDSSGHDEHVSRIRSQAQAPAKSRAARSLGDGNVARGRDDLHASAGRLARPAPVLPITVDGRLS